MLFILKLRQSSFSLLLHSSPQVYQKTILTTLQASEKTLMSINWWRVLTCTFSSSETITMSYCLLLLAARSPTSQGLMQTEQYLRAHQHLDL